MDALFFKPFVEGTLRTLRVQCNLEAKHEKPFIKGKAPQPQFDIAAVIGVTSSAFNGTITICFPEAVFLQLMSNMLGEKQTEITKDLEDGAAELLNIIFGQAKIVLTGQGYTVEKAIPTVIRGTNLKTSHSADHPVIVLPFKTSAGEFDIEIVTERKSL
ncbi:MAG: chemotaxis protein CheX [Oligoflexia bacterium]|nr:chemotaxis protein CheX [Oligoflexia bacterium]